MSTDIRVMPHSDTAERSVLGAIFLDNHALDEVRAQLGPEAFYRESHRNIYRGMLTLSDRKSAIDVITLADQLNAEGTLEAIGGPNFLAQLSNEVPSAANVGHYVGIVVRSSEARAQIRFARELEERAFGIQDAEAHRAWAESRFYDIYAQGRQGQGEPKRVRETIRDSLKALEETYSGKINEEIRASTHWPEVNAMLGGGFRAGELIIIAARPGMGKTSLALAIMDKMADEPKEAQRGAVLFSLEMGENQITRRMIAARARVPYRTIEEGKLNDPQWQRVIKASSDLADSNLWIDSTAALPITELRAKARRLVRREGVSLIVVDYLQLMTAPGHGRGGHREQEIAHISRELKACAKELGVPVIALSQLNRGVEQRADKRPMNSDLRESGQIEQDADIISFIYRDEVYNPESEDKGVAEFIIGKQRNGGLGTVKLRFIGQWTGFDAMPNEATEARHSREARWL